MENYEDFIEKFAIVMPVYNEEETIEATVLEIEKLEIPYLVVDDGSTDHTNQILYIKSIPHLTQYPNKGKGAAVRLGAQSLIDMGYEWVLIVDGDGQFALEDIEKMDNELLWHGCEYDIYNGNRLEHPVEMPKERYIANKWMSKIISLFAGQKIPDTQCGLKMIHRDVFTELKFKSNRFDFDTEILIKASRHGSKIKSIPIQCIYKKGRVSKMRPVRDFFRFIKVLFISLF